LQRITEKQNKVSITDRMWARVLCSTNQPCFLTEEDVEGAGLELEEEEPHMHMPLVEGGMQRLGQEQPVDVQRANGNGHL